MRAPRYQSFDPPPPRSHAAERLTGLRRAIAEQGLAGFLVPRSDGYLNEYVAACDERLAWLTGFTGSAGLAVVMAERAALFTDGRYALQAADQVDTSQFAIVQTPPAKLSDWLIAALPHGGAVGYDPRLHAIREITRLETALAPADITLAPLSANPVDGLWSDRPAAPSAPVRVHPLIFAGQSSDEKRARLTETLKNERLDAAFLADPHSVAWLLNLRGADIPHTPIALLTALIRADGAVTLYCAANRLEADARAALANITIAAPNAIEQDFAKLGAEGARVGLDPDRTPQRIKALLDSFGAEVVQTTDPCALPRACKNAVEIQGARAAHVRDGAAVVQFLAWLDREAPKGALDEIACAKRLEACRAATAMLREISFDTISGAGPNGAIVHYRVTSATNRRLAPGTLYLIDSGGQYDDGTTDITRTVAIGAPTAAMRRHYTLVLKGHIALTQMRFPDGTRGQDLDAIARAGLWAAGLDYDHGTGHGVGSFLSVHEGPQRIAKTGAEPLRPGMILSNEPGYYLAGQYGIRIENLILVTEPVVPAGGERPMLGFETLTLAPYDRALIDGGLLTPAERGFIDAYHARVFEMLAPDLKGRDLAWLKRATKPLPKPRPTRPGAAP